MLVLTESIIPAGNPPHIFKISIMKNLLTFFLLPFICFATDIESKFWPTFVNSKIEFEKADVSGTSFLVKSGARGTVQRLEKGRLLVDYGRFGLHWVDPESTDFVEEANKLQSDPNIRKLSNLVGQIGSRLIHYANEAPTHSLIEDVSKKNGIIFIFPGKLNPQNGAVFKTIDPALFELSKEYNAIPVVLPIDMKWYSYMEELNAKSSVIIPFMFNYRNKLHLQNKDAPSYVICNLHGKVLHRSETVQIDTEMKKPFWMSESKFLAKLSLPFKEQLKLTLQSVLQTVE